VGRSWLRVPSVKKRPSVRAVAWATSESVPWSGASPRDGPWSGGATRKFTRNRKIYPNEESALKLIYMAIREASQQWTMPVRHWKEALNHFAIMFEGRLPELASK